MSRQPRTFPSAEATLASGCLPERREETSAAGPDVRAVYSDHFSYVWHSVRRLGVPDKDLPDVVHDVFVAVARALPGYDRKRPIKPWLFGVAFRVTSDHLRLYRHTRELLGRQEDPPDIAPGPEQALLAQEARNLCGTALAQLDVPHRAVLIMFDIEGHDAHQIALSLDIPLKTVYSRLRSARLGFSAAAARLFGQARCAVRSDETPLPSLSPRSATLLAAERGAPPPPAAVRRAVWRRTRRTLLASGLAVPSLLAAKLSAAALGTKIVAVVFIGALAAAGVGELIGAQHAAPRVVPPAAQRSLASATPPQPASVVQAAATAQALVPPRPPAPARSTPVQFRARGLDLAHERWLIDRARAASVVAPIAAARLLERHRREFPEGLFAEEREAMLIITYARAGRTSRARRLALRFAADFPQSIHADRITAALAAAGR